METEDLNCTQFTVPYSPPGSDEAANLTISWLVGGIITVYMPIHNWLLITLVSFGVLTNIIVLSVLAHKEMRSSGVNVIMMLIAVCDFFCATAAVAQRLFKSTDSLSSYFNAYVEMTIDYFTVAFHASSLYLAVGMAFCRVMSLNLANKNRDLWQTPKYACRVAFTLCAPVFAIASMVFLIHSVFESEEDGIYLDMSDLSIANHCFFLKFYLFTAGALFKGLPCITMLPLSLLLLGRIEKGKTNSSNITTSQKDKHDKIERSSKLIQFVLIVFLVTELPQSLSNIAGSLFIVDHLNYYQYFGLFGNILAFLNTTTSFIIYSTLSSKFRRLFVQIFFPKFVTEKLYQMEVEDLNCTQFGVLYPPIGSEEAANITVIWLINTAVSAYRPIHYYLYTSIIVFSVFSNLLVLLVLTKKEMRSVGVNVTMMMIAFCDFMCAMSAVSQMWLSQASNYYGSYFNAYAQLTVDYLAVVFHSSSLYLAVGMAFCRVMTLSGSDERSDRWQTPKYALRVSLALCVPVFSLGFIMIPMHDVKFSEEDGVYLDQSDFSLENHCFYIKFCLITAGTMFKGIPCILMLTFSLLLVRKIKEGISSTNRFMNSQADKTEKIGRSTRMIQSVIVIFVVTELPQSSFSIAGGLFINDYLNYYQNLSIFLNVLAFLNTTTSFIIYSSLSSKFRKLFLQLFLPKSVTEKIYRKVSGIMVQPIRSSSRTI